MKHVLPPFASSLAAWLSLVSIAPARPALSPAPQGGCPTVGCDSGCTPATQIFSQEIVPTRPSSSYPDFVFPQFDPNDGVLKQVQIVVFAEPIDRSFGFENIASSPCAFSNPVPPASCPIRIDMSVTVTAPTLPNPTIVFSRPNFGTRFATLPNITIPAFDGISDTFSPAVADQPICPFADENLLPTAICNQFTPPSSDPAQQENGAGGASAFLDGSGFSICWTNGPVETDPQPVCLTSGLDNFSGSGNWVLDNVVPDLSTLTFVSLCNGNNDLKYRVKARLRARITYVYCPCVLVAGDVSADACSGVPETFCLPIQTGCGTTLNCTAPGAVTIIQPPAGQGTFALVTCPPGVPCSGCCVQYSPPAGFSGTVSTMYTATGSNGASTCTDSGAIVVDVCRVDAQGTTVAVCDGGSTSICLPIATLGACGAVPCSPANITITQQPAFGTLGIAGSCLPGTDCSGCCITYDATGVPAGVNQVTFTYQACSNGSPQCCDTGVVTINICRVDAQSTTAAVCDGGSASICLPITTLGGCGTVPCSPANITITQPPPFGTLGIVGSCLPGTDCTGCCITYNATGVPANVNQVTFTYQACTGGSPQCCDTGVVTIDICRVNAGDVRNLRACPGEPLLFCLPIAVTGTGCGSVPCSAANIMLTQPGPGLGTVALVTCPPGLPCQGCCVTYTAPSSIPIGRVTFGYTASTNTTPACSDAGTVTINVCRPQAVPDSATTCANEPIEIDVLANDIVLGPGECGQIDCHSLQLDPSAPVDPSCGSAAVLPGCPVPGSPCPGCKIVFTPNPSFSGPCTFGYLVSTNGNPSCIDGGPVTVTVDAIPNAAPDEAACPPEGPIIVDILANDQPGPGCGSLGDLVVTINQLPVGGDVVLVFDAGLGRIVAQYTRGPQFDGTDTFSYEITNTCGCSDKASVEINCLECVERNRDVCASLLLYPEYDNTVGNLTLLTVTDACCDLPGDTKIEVLFINKANCSEFNRTYTLTPCDTLSFITSSQAPIGGQGYVYLYAKNSTASPGNPNGTPIVRNRLIGQSMRISGITTFEYALNAVGFRGIGADGAPNDDDGDGIRDFNGPSDPLAEYDEVPDQIVIPRFLGQDPAPGDPFSSDIVLVALSGGSQFTTVLSTLVHDDNENPFSGQYTFDCWAKVPLRVFSAATLQTTIGGGDPGEIVGAPQRDAGWILIDGLVANSAQEAIDDPAFYAVLIERANGFTRGADLPWEICSQRNGDLLPQALLGDGPPFSNDDDQ